MRSKDYYYPDEDEQERIKENFEKWLKGEAEENEKIEKVKKDL